MIRVVLDANVLVSALISGNGIPGMILDAWLQGKFQLCVSPEIMKEMRHVLLYPRIAERLEAGDADKLIKHLGSLAEWVIGDDQLKILTRDPSDNIYLSCAAKAKCNFLVTGNLEHFQEAGSEFMGVRIVTPRQFFDIFHSA
jgi:putative PIN family toxin of toxin-antitoxin system